jgi:large subunit ribosomal protein L6
MSRIGKNPVPIPAGVEVKVQGQQVSAKGKLGQLSIVLAPEIGAEVKEGKVLVLPRGESKRARTMWGTSRSLVRNLVHGVSQGYSVALEINGVGYRAAVQGKALVMQLGFSHDVNYPIPEGIQIACAKPTSITVSGADRQKVGQVAAEIRGYKPPRSEERRVGKECRRLCRSRWSPYH